MKKDKNNHSEVAGSYPRSSPADRQQKEQSEFIDEQPASFEENAVGDVVVEEEDEDKDEN